MGFPPLSSYGAIGNDNRVALVSRDGSIDWCAFPHVEDASVFARILDLDRGGHYAIRPTGEYESEQRYVEETNVLETVFETSDGRAVLTDLMPVIDGVDAGNGRERPHERSIYRRLRCTDGDVEFELSFAPRFDYARAETTVTHDGDDVRASGGGEELHLRGDVDFEVDEDGGTATATDVVAEGETTWFGMQYGHPAPHSPGECERIIEQTIDHWHEWLETCAEANSELFEGRWGDEVTRSALVLKLLVHDETGAMPAAATTSIPEVVGGDRNWDYRYNWIRDANFTVQALYNVGQTEEIGEYFEWFMEMVHEDVEEIQPLYGLHGERDVPEVELDHLSGYRDSSPVRIGNGAFDQQQHDIYGTIVEGIYETTTHHDELDDEWEDVRDIVTHVCDVWRTPDAGIWEFRNEARHFTHSKLLCWVALDRGIELHDEYGFDAPVERWQTERDAIREAILERGYSEDAGAFVQYFGSDVALDATALLIPIYGFLPGDDERVQSTIDAVLDRLTTDDGLVVRFVDSDVREDERKPFVLCSFWLVDALALAGRIDEAEDVFTNVLDRTTPLNLLSEKIDPETGDLLGNFPQAFSHIGLLNSADYLTRARAEDASVDADRSR